MRTGPHLVISFACLAGIGLVLPTAIHTINAHALRSVALRPDGAGPRPPATPTRASEGGDLLVPSEIAARHPPDSREQPKGDEP